MFLFRYRRRDNRQFKEREFNMGRLNSLKDEKSESFELETHVEDD